MIAQLSQSEPRGSPASSRSGVRFAGSLARKSGVPFLPHTSISSKSSPAARTKIRTVRLLTLGLRMLRVLSAIVSLPLLVVGVLRRSVVRQRRPRASDQRLDRVREVLAVDVVVTLLDAQLVRLEEDVGVRVPERRLEAVRRELDQEAERVLE